MIDGYILQELSILSSLIRVPIGPSLSSSVTINDCPISICKDTVRVRMHTVQCIHGKGENQSPVAPLTSGGLLWFFPFTVSVLTADRSW